MANRRQERLRRMVEQATHESVTADRLDTDIVSGPGTDLLTRVSSGTNSRTIDSYLKSGEQPHFILTTKTEVPQIHGAPKHITKPRLNSIAHVITESRWLVIAGHKTLAQQLEVPLEAIRATNFDTESELHSHVPESITNNRFVFDTGDAYYDIPLSNQYDKSDLKELCGFLRTYGGATPRALPLDPDIEGYTLGGRTRKVADESTLSTLIDQVPPEAQDEATELVQTIDSPDKLVAELRELIANHQSQEAPKTLEEKVADADSLDGLRQDLRTPAEEQAARAQGVAQQGVEAAKQTAKDADPEVVGKWAKAGAKVAGPLFSANAIGVPVAVAGIATSGLIGAYADTHNESVLNEIDPTELQQAATAMQSHGGQIDDPNGAAIGAILGASHYLGVQYTPESYAQWVTQADPAAVLDGIDQAVAAGSDQQRLEQLLVGAMLGGAQGYVTQTATPETMDASSDDSEFEFGVAK